MDVTSAAQRGTVKPQDNKDLLRAFPSSVRDDVLAAVSVLPENPHGGRPSQVRVNSETIEIPTRVYHNTDSIAKRELSGTQWHLLSCILTRHRDGYVRQNHLEQIISCSYPWVPAYVIQLLGEYVVEIQQLIEARLKDLEPSVYRTFLLANPEFLAHTEQRVISYWDCFYRTRKRDDYVRFRVLHFFKELAAEKR
ncbi:MAG TPA: hypothetical protein VKH63_20810 [Candidatus Acidoferrum sp.]|jgi:hypothetical protein|nr:hypothetical protein [Candidatus Acidoferrum sp.]